MTFQEELVLLIIENLFIALIVAGTAFFLNKRLESYRSQLETRRAEDRLRAETALSHLETQISEFYGPLLGLIQYTAAVHAIEQKRLEGLEDPGKRGQIQHHFRKAYYLPSNSELAKLIRIKLHLLEGNDLPESFKSFLIHQAQLEALTSLGETAGIHSEGISPVLWPKTFESDVQDSLRKLQEQYKKYQERLTD